MNIPIYRAKIIDSEDYVIGFFYSRKWDGETRTEYYISYESLEWEIDPTTISIHFPNIIDIKGDKIFASLQEDGKGGDILFDMEYEFTLIFDGLKFRLEGLECNTEISGYDKFTDFDNIGIQR